MRITKCPINILTIKILRSISPAVQGSWAHSQLYWRRRVSFRVTRRRAGNAPSPFPRRGVLGEIRAPAKAGALLEHRTYPCTLGVWVVATHDRWPNSDECCWDLGWPDLAVRTLLAVPLGAYPSFSFRRGSPLAVVAITWHTGPIMGCSVLGDSIWLSPAERRAPEP